VPLPLTFNSREFTKKDRHTLAELFRKQSEAYEDVAERLDRDKP
jgi:hypothetical protein